MIVSSTALPGIQQFARFPALSQLECEYVLCMLVLLQNIIKTESYLKHVPNHLATKTISQIYKFDRARE